MWVHHRVGRVPCGRLIVGGWVGSGILWRNYVGGLFCVTEHIHTYVHGSMV